MFPTLVCVGVHIPALTELPLSVCGCKKSTLDIFGDHISTCTVHSGVKKTHDWVVEQLADLFHTTHRVKTKEVVRSRGQRCGDNELPVYLVNEEGPVYPHDLDRSLNEDIPDKIRQYLTDYNNRPSHTFSIIRSAENLSRMWSSSDLTSEENTDR